MCLKKKFKIFCFFVSWVGAGGASSKFSWRCCSSGYQSQQVVRAKAGPGRMLHGVARAAPYSLYTENGTSNRDKLAMSVRAGAVRLELGIDSDA